MEIYISSLAFTGMHVDEMLSLCTDNKIALEFSSGIPYTEGVETKFEAYAFPKLAHNYFPSPKIPFVLNLASSNDEIRRLSIDHCINGLNLSKLANAPFFAAHAGFCIDPKPTELGQKLISDDIQLINRESHWDIFIDSVKEIMSHARQLNVDFYIENNVLAPFNLPNSGQNPLLCCDAEEMTRLYDEISDNRFGLLLDTAHLKVSSRTLNFDLEQAIEAAKQTIKAIHHSDNDGSRDTNEPITESYWFLPLLKEFAALIHVVEVRNLSISEINTQINFLNSN